MVCRDSLRFANDVVQNDCCNSVFHRRCLGSLALSAGYFFKCPLCNNTDQFRRCMRQKGIFIPDRDASWELENNAFVDLYTPTYSCEAKKCVSKRGRKFNSVDGFAFLSCSSCGAGSVHQKCCPTPDYVCDICTKLFNRTENDFNNTTLNTSVVATPSVVENFTINSPPIPANTPMPVSPSDRRRSNRLSLSQANSPASPLKTRPNNGNSRGAPFKRRRLC